jgi:hypothetical protein
MELIIIQYSLATVFGIYLISIPFRIILMLRDIPNTLWLYSLSKNRWKKYYDK